jgi:hypothetical protein
MGFRNLRQDNKKNNVDTVAGNFWIVSQFVYRTPRRTKVHCKGIIVNPDLKAGVNNAMINGLWPKSPRRSIDRLDPLLNF